jgi:hypothetical protein
MLRNFVQFGLVLTMAMMSPVPVFAQSSPEIIPQTPGLHPMCLVFPDRPLTRASNRSDTESITCAWGTAETGLAYVDTFSGDKLATFRVMQEFQATDFLHNYDGQPGYEVEDIIVNPNLNCTEFRMMLWRHNGDHVVSHTTALCGGVGINYATFGAYVEDLQTQFAAIVRANNTSRR